MNSRTPLPSSSRDFLNIIFKRKYQIALFFIITVTTIVGITYSIEPTYKATAQILVNIGSRNVYTLPGSTREMIDYTSRSNQINTEIEFLKSRVLAESVIKYLGAENVYPKDERKEGESGLLNRVMFKNPIAERIKKVIPKEPDSDGIKEDVNQPSIDVREIGMVQSNLSIQNIPNTNIITISFKHNDPKIAATVANTYMRIYLDERIQLRKNPQSSTFLKDQSQELHNRLEEEEQNLENFKNENNISDLQTQQRHLLQQIADLRVELNTSLSEETETESRIALIKQQLSQTPETVPQDEVTNHNELLISQLEAKLVELQIEEKELLSKYTPQSRMVTNVRERISIVKEKINEQENKLYQRKSVGVNATYQRLKEDLLKNQAELDTLGVKKQMLNKQLAEYQSEVERLNQLETKLNRLEQSVNLYRRNYELYQAKLEASRIEDAMDTEKINDVSIMNEAVPFLKPISPKYKLNIILSVFLGLFGGLLFAIIRDYMDDSLETPEDVENGIHLTVLTSIPDTNTGKRLDHRKVETSRSNFRIPIP